MADQKISARTAASALDGTEILGLIQGGVDVRDTVQNVSDFIATNLSLPKYTYAAILSQTGTGNPTPTVLSNNIPGTVTWTRNSSGQFIATSSTSSFVANKSIGFCNNAVPDTQYQVYRTSDSVMELDQQDLAGTPIDGLFGNFVELRIYN